MAEFEVKVHAITAVSHHPQADRLDIVYVAGTQAISSRDRYSAGDLVVLAPEDAVIPAELLERMGLAGKLDGAEKNIVRPVRLRGVMSHGLLIAPPEGAQAGDDVAEALGIRKRVTKAPRAMQYKRKLDLLGRVSYDFGHLYRSKHVLTEGERIELTEKIHGTFVGFGVLPDRMTCFSKQAKGGHKAGVIVDLEDDEPSVYRRAFDNLQQKLQPVRDTLIRVGVISEQDAIYLLGEIYGDGIQDLTYGGGESFRAFDIAVRRPFQLEPSYIDAEIVRNVCAAHGVATVPVLYRGPYSPEIVEQYASGLETVSGASAHVREGVVLRPIRERVQPGHGRIIFKCVSPEYYTRGDQQDNAD